MKQFDNLGKLVKKGRENNTELSQERLAELLGFKNGQFISNVERGTCSVPSKRLAKLASLIEVDLEEIIEAKCRDYKETIRLELSILEEGD